MKRTNLVSELVAVVLVVGLILIGYAGDVNAQKKEKFRLAYGAGSSVSGSYPFNIAVGKALTKYAPNLEVTLMETGGGADNWRRISMKEVHVAMFSTTHTYEIYHGVGKTVQNKNVRGLVPLRPTPLHFVVRKDTDIYKMKDLNGKKFNPGNKGSQTEVRTREALKILNIKPDYFFGSTGEAVNRFQSRQIDGFMRPGAPPDAKILEIQVTLPIRLIGFTPQEWQQLSLKLKGSPKMRIAAGTYSGQTEDIITTGVIAGVGTTKDLISEEIAYEFVKAFCLGFDEFIRPVHKSMNAIKTPEDWIIDAYLSPLHAGAIKYLREKGKTIPPELVPPEAK